MAEYIMKSLAKENNLDIEVKSAGIAGNPANRIFGALEEVFKEENIDYSLHTSKPLTKELVDWADVILVMEKSHLEYINDFFPEARSKTFLLTEFAGEEGRNLTLFLTNFL